MIAGDIGPHPDSPDYYINMGKPAGMKPDECGDLMVRLVGITGDALPNPVPVRIVSLPKDADRVYPGFMSEWYPTADEWLRLLSGAPIRLLIVGAGLPPVSLWVPEKDEL